ncbi:hypothetical protein ACC809_36820, partial [Rhizobium johnstonii]
PDMSTSPDYPASKPSSGNLGLLVSAALAVIFVAAIAFDTTVVRIGSENYVRTALAWNGEMERVRATMIAGGLKHCVAQEQKPAG